MSKPIRQFRVLAPNLKARGNGPIQHHRVGQQVTAGDFDDGVMLDALVAGGHLAEIDAAAAKTSSKETRPAGAGKETRPQ